MAARGILRAGLVAGLVAASAAPALAEGAATCGQPPTGAGLFDWAGPPSTVCRDRGARATALPRPPAPQPASVPAGAAADTGLSLSVDAYVGMAWAF